MLPEKNNKFSIANLGKKKLNKKPRRITEQKLKWRDKTLLFFCLFVCKRIATKKNERRRKKKTLSNKFIQKNKARKFHDK